MRTIGTGEMLVIGELIRITSLPDNTQSALTFPLPLRRCLNLIRSPFYDHLSVAKPSIFEHTTIISNQLPLKLCSRFVVNAS